MLAWRRNRVQASLTNLLVTHCAPEFAAEAEASFGFETWSHRSVPSPSTTDNPVIRSWGRCAVFAEFLLSASTSAYSTQLRPFLWLSNPHPGPQCHASQDKEHYFPCLYPTWHSTQEDPEVGETPGRPRPQTPAKRPWQISLSALSCGLSSADLAQHHWVPLNTHRLGFICTFLRKYKIGHRPWDICLQM